MPGATARNIRKADIAEDLGKLLLRHFCAIAPISKSDDFGIDAIATILKLDPHSALRELANKSFGIQFKSKNVRFLEFTKEYQYTWLLNLDYPYFIGSVDIANSSMKIYTLHMINGLPGFNKVCTGLIISLDELESDEVNRDDQGNFRMNIGPPIVSISITDIENPKIIEEKRNILNKWILNEYDNIKVRDIGFTKVYNWETNEEPVFSTVNKIFEKTENIDIYKESFDFIDATLVELERFNKNKYLSKGIKNINTTLKQKGIDLFMLNDPKYRRLIEKFSK